MSTHLPGGTALLDACQEFPNVLRMQFFSVGIVFGMLDSELRDTDLRFILIISIICGNSFHIQDEPQMLSVDRTVPDSNKTFK